MAVDLKESESELISLCGAAKLLSVILQIPEWWIRDRLGLPLNGLCPKCGGASDSKHYPYCRHCGSRIEVECYQCGKHFFLLQSDVLCRAKANKHLYCSQRCVGAYVGKHYGFGSRVTEADEIH